LDGWRVEGGWRVEVFGVEEGVGLKGWRVGRVGGWMEDGGWMVEG
jgi:hypothetical protein